MARRSGGRGRTGGGWGLVALLVAGALALWWLSARRAEAPSPPPNIPGARAIREAAPAAGRVDQAEPHGAEEITPPEKQELERVLRERGGVPAR